MDLHRVWGFVGGGRRGLGRGAWVIAAALVPGASAHGQLLVQGNNFDTSIPATISPGVAALAGVQGYAGLGPAGDQFGGQFLRSPTGNVVTMTLTDLPAHTTISIEFLFAAIDSLDGTGSFPQGDFFKVTLDGAQIFRESFANALDSQVQSYVPPAGVELARKVDLGFSGPGGWYRDSAYNLGADPAFHDIAHTASTATFTFQIEGPGIQSLGDESWAMDNLRVTIDAAPGCDDIDFNNDEIYPDIQDLLDYLNVFAGGACSNDPDCGDIDFNNDEIYPDTADLELFLAVFGGGTC